MNLTVSDFFLPEVAAKVGKDARTLRRWCQAGRVAGAFQTPGGHWRIAAPSVTEAAISALRGARGFSRKRRGGPVTIGGQPVPRHFVERVEKMKRNQRKQSRVNLAVLRVLNTMPEKYSEDGLFESPFLAAASVSALAWALTRIEGVEELAAAFGMPRRMFYRKLGGHLPEARKLAELMGDQVRPEAWAFGDAVEDGGPVFVGVDFHESATDDEKRRWAGALHSCG